MLRRDFLVLTAAGLAAPSVVRAQDAAWPSRPIQLIVPWLPGDAADIMARVMQPKMSEALGKPVAILNRAGASGAIGATEAARAAPDGYTWAFVPASEALNQTSMRLPYRLLQAFAPVGLVSAGPLALVAHAGTPWRSVADLVAAAKCTPDTIAYASPGVGTIPHVSTTLLQQVAEMKMTHVPYRGAQAAVQAVLSGDVPLALVSVVTANQHIRAGTLRALAVTTEAESRHLPGVQSVAQQGFPGFEATVWSAFLGRTGTPEPILRRMAETLSAILAQPEVRDRIEQQGADVVAGGPERARRFLTSEVAKWGQVIRDNNITAES